jgi:hypothetical protein
MGWDVRIALSRRPQSPSCPSHETSDRMLAGTDALRSLVEDGSATRRRACRRPGFSRRTA